MGLGGGRVGSSIAVRVNEGFRGYMLTCQEESPLTIPSCVQRPSVVLDKSLSLQKVLPFIQNLSSEERG
jgi:hypothetical protein